MKKSLIALAVASVFVAPAAWAQISLYGKAHLSLDMRDTGATSGETKRNTLSSVGSRLGFRASEKLSDDLSANVGIETTIGFDHVYESASATLGSTGKGGAVLGDRGVGASLSSKSMGTLNAGFGGTPLKGATRGMDLFDGTVGANDGLLSNRKFFNNNGPNGIGYTSPSIGGISVTVGKGFTESAAASAGDGALHVLVGYKAGPISAFVTQSVSDSDSTGAGSAVAKMETVSFGGSVSMDAFTAIGIYEANSNTGTNAVVTDHTGIYLAGKFNISKTDAVKVAYTTIGNSKVGGAVATANGDKQIVVGYDRNLSKDTKVYALYSRLTNNVAAAPTATILSLGLMKNF